MHQTEQKHQEITIKNVRINNISTQKGLMTGIYITQNTLKCSILHFEIWNYPLKQHKVTTFLFSSQIIAIL